jgi:zinc and cadmium transporter
MTNIKLGIVTTIAVVFHEIPQEMGDFATLIYGGFTKAKALLFNFLCALTAVLGAVAGYLFSGATVSFTPFLLSFTAGGFIYIAASDLIPELHKQRETRKANLAFVTFVLGVLFMALLRGAA